MPQVRDESFTCFVHGHGANYSTTPEPEKKPGLHQRLLTPITLALSRKRAEAQLAVQRLSGKAPAKEQS